MTSKKSNIRKMLKNKILAQNDTEEWGSCNSKTNETYLFNSLLRWYKYTRWSTELKGCCQSRWGEYSWREQRCARAQRVGLRVDAKVNLLHSFKYKFDIYAIIYWNWASSTLTPVLCKTGVLANPECFSFGEASFNAEFLIYHSSCFLLRRHQNPLNPKARLNPLWTPLFV